MTLVSKVQYDEEGYIAKDEFITPAGKYVIGHPDKDKLDKLVKKLGKGTPISVSCFHYVTPINGYLGYTWPADLIGRYL